MFRNILLTTAAFTAVASTSNAAIVINEVYAGGGSSSTSASYTRDFVELYNTSVSPVILTNFTLQYGPASASNSFQTLFAFLAGSVIGPGDYLTIGTGTAGTGGATLSATQINNVVNGASSLSNTAGAVRLIDDTGAVVDLVGYGTTLVTGPDGFAKSEGAAAPAPTSVAFSLNRTNFSDTGVNSADFTNVAPSPVAGLTSTAITPEPASLALLGLSSVALLRRRR